VTAEARFLRLPRLEHPRLFFRKSDLPAIQSRIARYPNLYRRYADWLERMSAKEGPFPGRFLPPGLTEKACAAAAPPGLEPSEANDRCAWRMYELGWRMLAAAFTLSYLKPDSQALREKVGKLLAEHQTDSYVQFHHHGPFFPGAVAGLVDLAPDEVRSSLDLYQQMARASGEMNTLPWTLITLEEPVTPAKRALIYEIMTLENNAERYFEAHRGARGGVWWENPYTSCHCPMQGWGLAFMFLHNVFGEPRLFEKPIFRGFFTFQRYADPLRDNRKLQPNRRGPNGEPWRWIFTSLSRHPLEKSTYQWDEWLKMMEDPLAGQERAAVDDLMALEGRELTGPLEGGASHFVSAVSVPIALALGWYEPEAVEVKWQELPPTTVFDVEGWVPMRSGWGAQDTEVTFMSGVRDHTTRHKPNHFTITRGGEYLIGTANLMGDDGCNRTAWGNTVVVGDDWQTQWGLNLQHPRDGEHTVINRFSSPTWAYLARDRRLIGYKPAEEGFGGGLDLHGHTETLFMREGQLLAYQTWPQVDYAAGEASNAWPADQVSLLDRQLVFVKPDLVVIYDRVKLGPGAKQSAWIAAAAPELTVRGGEFKTRSGSQNLHGRVLLPLDAIVSAPEPMKQGWLWKGQKLLEIKPSGSAASVEYLVLMWVGEAADPLPAVDLVQEESAVGLRMAPDSRTIEMWFNRRGPVGGSVVISDQEGKATRYELRPGIFDSYANWSADPRYQQWIADPRFEFMEAASEIDE